LNLTGGRDRRERRALLVCTTTGEMESGRFHRYQTPPRPLDVNYDEAQVPPYTLPDALLGADGVRIDRPSAWWQRRRPELLACFEREVYGRVPELELRVEVSEAARDPGAIGGLATRLELDVLLRGGAGTGSLSLQLLLFLPNAAARPSPVFLGLNLFGNQSVHPDPKIRLARGFVANDATLGIHEHAASEASRGGHARRWPVELVMSRGYALATLYAGDLDPDFDDAFELGVHGAFDAGAAQREDAWGALAAWAFGLSRALDALAQLPELDAQRVAVIGHSRLGKAALWAAANDQRFALAIANESGRGGAALSRRRFGETVRHLNQRFPHWFCRRFKHYADREHELPIDQHELLALIAPRPLYVASAAQDSWCDPYGEFLSCRAASPVFEFLGVPGLGVQEPPPLGVSVGGHLAYHVRAGGHDLTVEDWRHYLAFADRHL
jgi:hypothetical protein